MAPSTLLADLQQAIAHREVLVVVGAGVSIGATRGEIAASWPGLLKQGVSLCEDVARKLPEGWGDRVRAEIDSGDMDDMVSAAEKVARKLGGPKGGEYRRWLREAVGNLRANDRSVLEALRGLQVPIATTNYDDLLEEITGLPPVLWDDPTEMERVLRGDARAILHLHGHWRRPESVILGIRSYEDILRDNRAQNILRTSRTIKTLLFVGCGAGLQDPNWSALLQWTHSTFAGSEYRHFRLAKDDEVAATQAEHLPEDRIFVLGYGQQHRDLAPFLQSLAAVPCRTEAPCNAATTPYDAHDLGDPLARYRDQVRDRSDLLAEVFRRLGGPQALSEVFVEVSVQGASDERWKGFFDGEALPGRACRIEDIPDLTHKRWSLLGDPGCGKTTLLHHLALHLLGDGNSNGTASPLVFIPILLAVSEICEVEGRLLDVASRVYRLDEAARDALTAALRGGRAVVLLDGLDEALDPATAQSVVRAVAADCGPCSLVVASRTIGYEAPSTEFWELRVQSLGEVERRKLLLAWVGDETHVARALGRMACNARLLKMAENPLLLTLAGLVMREGHEVPERRGQLYRLAVEQLLTKGWHPTDATQRLKEPHSVLRALSAVALALHGDAAEVWRTEQVHAVLAAAPRVERLYGDLDTFLDDVAKISGLLVPYFSPGSTLSNGYRFPHRTLREFLAATALERSVAETGIGEVPPNALENALAGTPRRVVRAPGKLGEILKKANSNPATWSEVLALTCGLLGEGGADALVRRVAVEGCPELTARVVADAEGIEPDTVLAVLGLDRDPDRWEARRDLIASLPTLLGSAEAAIRLAARFARTTTDGTDLWWTRQFLRDVAGDRLRDVNTSVLEEAADLADHVLDHLDTKRRATASSEVERLAVDIPAGSFEMGSTERQGYRAEHPKHSVEITRPFRLMTIPVTWALYELFDPAHRSRRDSFDGRIAVEDQDSHPVYNVTWYAAALFAEWVGGHLPPEAAWEYACRAGTTGPRYGKNVDEIAWHRDNSGGHTCQAGVKKPNTLGLYDMLGNVWEWTSGAWTDNYEYDAATVAPLADPAASPADADRVIRGGGWWNDPKMCRSAFRSMGDPRNRGRDQGFRVLLPANPHGAIDPPSAGPDKSTLPLLLTLLDQRKVKR